MVELLWDASGLAKRYTQENGSEVVQALFDAVPLSQMITTIWGYAETFSILLRRHNAGVISEVAFTTATSALENEIINNTDTRVLTVDDSAVIAGISLMKKHNLNSTDAAILSLFLRYANTPDTPVCVMVAADKRLLRAAQAEGLAVIDPETFAAKDVTGFLTAL